MLVAPFPSIQTTVGDRTSSPKRPLRRGSFAASRHASGSPVLMAWLIFGVVTLTCIPAARGNAFFGATLPFWLVAAPLINLAWCRRHRIAAAVKAWAASPSRRTRLLQAQRMHGSPSRSALSRVFR